MRDGVKGEEEKRGDKFGRMEDMVKAKVEERRREAINGGEWEIP